MASLRWRVLTGILVLALLALLLIPGAAPAACPFCVDERGPTLVGDYFQASMVIYGHFINPKLDAAGGFESGTTDFVIEEVLKPHQIIEGKKIITLPKYIPSTKSKFIVFCDEYKGNVNPYRGEEVPPASELLQYLKGALKFRDATPGERLRYCFDFLNNPDLTVSTDAYREFAKADYTDYRDIARKLPASTIAQWLEDPKTPAYRYGLYASFLGHCGDPKVHGELLRSMLEDPKKRPREAVDGLMAGYVMLQPKEAFGYVQRLLKDESEDYMIRYVALSTLRFFWETRTDVLSKDQVLRGMEQILYLPDMADFAMDDLRQWKAWEFTDKILDLFKKESHDHVVVKRAVLRFALSSPTPRAAEFVRNQRKLDPTWVSDTEELLRVETPPPKLPPVDAKKK